MSFPMELYLLVKHLIQWSLLPMSVPMELYLLVKHLIQLYRLVMRLI
jgi:hypothetical protein